MRAALVLALLLLPTLAQATERRAALLVGESAGEGTDVPLRYALTDVDRMRDVLVEVGGVPSEAVTTLRGASASTLRTALETLEKKLLHESWGPTDRVFVYVSSHARDGELRLAGTRFPVAELRRALDAWPVGVAVLVLDTCDAGSMFRTKGLELLAGEARVDVPTVAGRVVIAAAGPGEQALESDAVGGSHFTQHFVAGLRGAADVSHDGRVTLDEAYEYARAHTVDTALATPGAVQTPMFDVRLAGEGQLVLSEPSGARGRLQLDVIHAGDFAVRTADGQLVAKFSKGRGPLTFALAPGAYRVRARTGDRQLEGAIVVGPGEVVLVDAATLDTWPLVVAGRKGSDATSVVAAGFSSGSASVPNVLPTIGWTVEVQGYADAPFGTWRPTFRIAFSHRVAGAHSPRFVQRELDLVSGIGASLRTGEFQWRLSVDAGVRGTRQEGLPGGDLFNSAPSIGAGASLAWIPLDWLQVEAALSGGLLVVNTTGGWLAQPMLSGTLVAGYRW